MAKSQFKFQKFYAPASTSLRSILDSLYWYNPPRPKNTSGCMGTARSSKINRFSEVLSICLFLFLPLSSLYIHVASVLLQQVVPEKIPKWKHFSTFLISLILLRPLSSLHILVAPDLLQQVVPGYKIKNLTVYQIPSQYLCFSTLLPPLSIYW